MLSEGQLEHHAVGFSFHLSKVRDHLLDNNNIVRGSSIRERIRLAGADDRVKVGFESICNDLIDDLILRIAKTYGSEVSEV